MRSFVDKLFRGALNHRRSVIVVALVFLVASALCIPGVKINYQFSDYLPEDSASTISLHVMNDAFDAPTPNAQVMVEGLSLMQASDLANQMQSMEGIEDVMWLGTTCDISVPLETYDSDAVAAWKSGDTYLYQVALDTSQATSAIESIQDAATALGANDVAMAGDAVNSATASGVV